ncbi:MAG TPA: class I fructose-bisphosphate aldolase, partial [Allocoleopsis sp.]
QQGVVLEQMILKPNMVVSGKQCPNQANIEQVAGATVYCLRRTVPAAVPGIAFLSGGQSSELAAAHLNAMHTQYGDQLPWQLTFSYSRAIQQPALEAWRGDAANVPQAQRLLLHWAKCNSAASQGNYTAEMGKQVDAAIGNTKPLQLLSQD